MAISKSYAHEGDPQRLRDLLSRSLDLAADHELSSVVVGLAGSEGDLLLPELIDYLESALRMEDAIFRLTRERAVLFLRDVDRASAERILTRLMHEFRERFPVPDGPPLVLGYYEIGPGSPRASVKEVLPRVFPEPAGGLTH